MGEIHKNRENLFSLLSAQDSIRLLTSHFYQDLFYRLYLIIQGIRNLDTDNYTAQLQPLSRKLTIEIEEMFRKERFTLFPLLEQLERENRKLNDCRPLNNIKAHHALLQKIMAELIGFLETTLEEERSSQNLVLLLERANELRNNIDHLQVQKEKYLFNRFVNSPNPCYE